MHSFKRPTEQELAHDYLWRVHPHVPGNGEITVFNRSHYEDVLVVKVHGYAPLDVVEKRYEHIRNFEQMLVDEGTTIIKIFLHISKDEQKGDLKLVSIAPKKLKFKKGDIKERAFWEQYHEVFEQMLKKTTTDDSPWYVVPADNKKYRDEIISSLILETLESFKMQWPQPKEDLSDIVIE